MCCIKIVLIAVVRGLVEFARVFFSEGAKCRKEGIGHTACSIIISTIVIAYGVENGEVGLHRYYP